MFERKDTLFHELMEMSPSFTAHIIILDLGITVKEVNELLYNPIPGIKNDFEKMMAYEPTTEDCAKKLGMCLGGDWNKETFLLIDRSWKELLEKKGLPLEAYQDFFQYCFGFKVL